MLGLITYNIYLSKYIVDIRYLNNLMMSTSSPSENGLDESKKSINIDSQVTESLTEVLDISISLDSLVSSGNFWAAKIGKEILDSWVTSEEFKEIFKESIDIDESQDLINDLLEVTGLFSQATSWWDSEIFTKLSNSIVDSWKSVVGQISEDLQ